MKILDNLTHFSFSTNTRFGQVTALAAAGVFFVLTIAAGYMGLKTSTVILGALTGGAVGVAILFSLWTKEWVWRFIERTEPKTEASRRVQFYTSVMLICLAFAALIISLLNG